jgi:hypothetical protein
LHGLDRLKRIAQKQRNMQRLLQTVPQNASLLGQIDDLTEGLDPSSTATLLWQLAWQCHLSGRWDLACDVMMLLAERFPEQPCAAMALAWGLRYESSSEAACRMGRKDKQRLERAARLGERLQKTHPLLFADPKVRFPLAVASRELGRHKPPEQFFLGLSRTSPEDAWRACAAGERWIAQRYGEAPKPVWHCRRTAVKPFLDGVLDETCWTDAQRIALKSPRDDDTDWPAEIMLAYDQDFLYLACHCRKAVIGHAVTLTSASTDTMTEPRPRDADLAEHDRVAVLFDVDRDYTTFYELSLDQRSWPRETCWGDPTWNPTWYLTTRDDQESWSAEAAVGWADISHPSPAANTVWAAGAQRVIPGVGFQSWTRPADVVAVPEGFGYLVFE